jgi:hypothetical protein
LQNTLSGSMRLSEFQDNFTFAGSGTLAIPSSVTAFGATYSVPSQLIGKVLTVNIGGNYNYSTSTGYLSASGTLDLGAQSFAGGTRDIEVTAGLNITLPNATSDGGVSFFGNLSANPVTTTSFLLTADNALTNDVDTPAISGTYDATADSPVLILSASWTNPATAAPTLSIIEPDGTTLSESDFGTAGILDVDSLDSSTSENLAILSPEAGNWQLEVDDASSLGAVSFGAFAEPATPTLALTAPTATLGGGWQFNWTAGNLPPNASITFYASSDNTAFDGTPISGGLTASTSGQFVWNGDGVPPGSYYVYAELTGDGVPPTDSYASDQPHAAGSSVDLVLGLIGTGTIVAGGNSTIDMQMANSGSTDVTSANVLLQVPAGFIVEPDQTGVAQDGSSWLVRMPDIPSGETVDVPVVVESDGTTLGLLSTFNAALDIASINTEPGGNSAALGMTEVQPVDVSWLTDISGDFDDPTKWSGGDVPSAGNDATIDFADDPQVVHDTGSDIVNGLTNTAGDFVLSGGSLTATTLENDSTMGWTGGSLILNGGPLLNTGTLSISGNGQRLSVSGSGTVSNAGTILVSGATGEADIDATLTNNGEITVNQGTLSLNGGGNSNAYLLQDGIGGTLQFGTQAANGTGGTFTITGGFYSVANTVVNGSTLDLSAATPITFADALSIAAGSLTLGAQDAADQGAFTQTGGIIAGSGTLGVYGAAALDGGAMTGGGTTQLLFTSTIGGSIALDGGYTLANAGRLNWSSGDIELGAGDPAAASQSATLANAVGALLYVTANASITAPGTAATVTNAGGLVVYAGAGETDIDASLTNTGVIQLQSGTLSLNGGGSSSGSDLFVAAPAVLQFGTTADGGSFMFSVIGGVYIVGSTMVNGGTLDVSAASGAVFPSLLEITAGQLSLGTLSATDQSDLVQTGGSIASTGTLTVYGATSLIGGVETGSGVTQLLGTSTMGGTFALDGGRTVVNDGWLNWSSGNIELGGGDPGAVTQAGTLSNASVLYVTANGRLSVGSSGTGMLNNSGVVAVLAGAGTTNIDATLDSSGVIQLQSGTLSLNDGGSSSGSDLFVAAGAVLQFGTSASGGSGTFRVTGAAYTVGSTVVTGGTLDLSAAAGARFANSLSLAGSGVVQLGTLTASAAEFSLSTGGTLAGSGFFFVGGNAQLGGGLETGAGATILTQDASIGSGAELDGGRTLQNDATLVWSGGTLTLGGGDTTLTTHGATLSNVAGAVLAIEGDGSVVSAGSGLLVNAGTIEKSGGLGVTTMSVAVNNTGTVDVSSGTLTLEQGVSGNGAFLLDGASTLDFVLGAGSGSTLNFLHPGGTLETQALGTFASAISGFVTRDEIDAASVGFMTGTTSVGFNAGTLTVREGTQSASFSLSGTYAAGLFQIASDGHGGTEVTYG